MQLRSLLQYRKDPRFIVSVPLFILITTSLVYYFIQQANELSPEALSSRLLLFVLWNINLILILGILFVLLRGLIKLILDRQRGILGSRFRTKLVATYVVTSMVPIVFLFVIATDLLRVSVDRWFNMPVRTVLENSEEIAQIAQDEAKARAAEAANEIADGVERENLDELLQHVRRYHRVALAGTYVDGAVVRLIADPRAPIHEIREPSLRFFEEVEQRGEAHRIEIVPSGKWIRVGRQAGDGATVAVSGVFVPASISRMIDENIIAHQQFRQLDLQRQSLKASQTSLFLAVTLAILFGTLWLAISVSRRITIPIQALAEGTQTLAAGGYGHTVDVRATDEFGLLIDSFNDMSGQLASQRTALTESNSELQNLNRQLDEERAFLATILGSVSTGIVTFTDELELLSINGAARRILHLDQADRGEPLSALFDGPLAPILEYVSSLQKGQARPREITVIADGELRYLELVAAPLRGVAGQAGWVLAIEDSTQLVQAQKLAAWSEAARRIAHEIKNPLTPIQLSAERIARKAAEPGSDFRAIADQGCRTIVNEVAQLKRMVDEFSRFARMPAIHLRRSSIATLLHDVASLYRDILPAVELRVEADPEIEALVDPEQIRRAVINLVDNALEATSEGAIELRARLDQGTLLLEVSDTGRGVPDEEKEKLFLPYFSTKERGTGLGLAIVHRIVHDHDGQISVHDNDPTGTIFEIRLPA